jgi:3-isopropylmalate/(R)-2-methylmalate dehydratase large subunit
MPMTLAEKIIARAAGRTQVSPGEIVTARVDLAMIHDSGGPRRVEPILRRLGARIWDPARVALVIDHYLPADNPESESIVAGARRFAGEQRLGHFFDGEGICHVVVPQRGLLTPGMFVVGGDSHSPTGGAFGAYMFGIGATEMAGVLATGEIWLEVPGTIRIEWNGRFHPGVSAKDVMLFLCGRLGMDGGGYQAVEYAGDAIATLSMQERMTMSNMTAELGGQTGLVAPDAVTAAAIEAAGGDPGEWACWKSDSDATVMATHAFDAASLSPQVASPHSPANAKPVEANAGTPIDVAYIGACTGAKLADMRMAADVLRGRTAASGVSLLLAPASKRDETTAASEGTLDALRAAGAQLLPNACGICAGYGSARFGENVTAISTTARNFRGRMGAESSQVYLASPYTVAASAIEGRIADPRPYLQGRLN